MLCNISVVLCNISVVRLGKGKVLRSSSVSKRFTKRNMDLRVVTRAVALSCLSRQQSGIGGLEWSEGRTIYTKSAGMMGRVVTGVKRGVIEKREQAFSSTVGEQRFAGAAGVRGGWREMWIWRRIASTDSVHR